MDVKHSQIHQLKKIAKKYGVKGIHDISMDEDNEEEFTFKDCQARWYIGNLRTKKVSSID